MEGWKDIIKWLVGGKDGGGRSGRKDGRGMEKSLEDRVVEGEEDIALNGGDSDSCGEVCDPD